jgi:iron(III) transport system ATP-binding protein
MLELVGLPHLAERMPQALSGGQQQRVALARALAPQPEILLLDEPFSNLDAALRLQVRAEVRSILRETGTTAIFVTHDQEEALSLSDKIAVMLNGTIAQFETPQQIYTHPVSKAVAQFVGEANFVPAQASGTRASSALGDVTLLNPMIGDVDLLVRPEMIHLDPAQEGVSGQILWSEYYGHQQRVGLRLADYTSLIVRTEAQIVYTPGQQVRIRVYAPLWAYRQA